MNDPYGKLKTALITGASSGIGVAFAEQLASAGLDLILVARSTNKLNALARKLRKEGCRVEVISQDLSTANAGSKLSKSVAELGMTVDLLINNAGFGTVGHFDQQSAAREAQEVKLNALAVVDLTHAFLPKMLSQGHGGVINVASVAAFQAVPFMSVYAATKAFVLSFSEGLWGEYRSRGLKVVCLCPGPVDTGFFEATGNAKLRGTVPKSTMMTADRVVASALKSLRKGDLVVVPGAQNQAVAWMSKFMPRAVVTTVAAKMMKR